MFSFSSPIWFNFVWQKHEETSKDRTPEHLTWLSYRTMGRRTLFFTEENTEKYISFFQDINVSLSNIYIYRFSAYKTNVTGIFSNFLVLPKFWISACTWNWIKWFLISIAVTLFFLSMSLIFCQWKDHIRDSRQLALTKENWLLAFAESIKLCYDI